MRFRFTGQYTNGHTSINACGVVFEGREPADVTEESAIARMIGHPEFEAVADKPGLVRMNAVGWDDPLDLCVEEPLVLAKPKRAYKRRASAQ